MPNWQLRIERKLVQTRGTRARTVGTYQVLHDGVPATGTILVDGIAVPLSGTTAESKGPSQNAQPATAANPSRIVAKTYPLATSGGPEYVTHGFRDDLVIDPPMPAIELLDTGNRTAILIHPGKDTFLSSIGCINLCTRLPDAAEIINYPGSRRRVIALIRDMQQFLGNVPTAGDRPIPGASVTIDESRLDSAQPAAAHPGDTVDGRAVASEHGVERKLTANISSLHPRMAAAIAAVADAARALQLPTPVITSGNDSSHKVGSLHFRNRALDFRGNNITDAQGVQLQNRVAAALGADFDVIFERFPANPSNDHLHVEFDPE